MTDFDEPKKRVAHEIGSSLDALSVGELALRIELLEAEIVRLKENIAAKSDSLSAAESVFGS